MSLVAWFQLGMIGMAVATSVFFLAWWRKKTLTFHRLVMLTSFFVFDLILFGAFTRLTDSGLGCPDWPGCYGTASPIGALEQIKQAQDLMPTGPVTLSKAWIEMIHRYMAMGVGCLIIVMVAWVWIKRDTYTSQLKALVTGALFLVCIQGAFGAWTVTLKLQPVIVTIHLMLGLTLLAWLGLISTYTNPQVLTAHAIQGRGTVMGRHMLWIGLLVLVVQIFLGAWVSTNYAVLACDDFPTCHGEFYPSMNFSEGFHLWRELGKTAAGHNLSIEALRAIHWTHRVGAIVTFFVLLYVAFRALRVSLVASCPTFRRWAFGLFAVLCIQLLSGMSNIILDWPIEAALIHTGGAAALVYIMVKLLTIHARLFPK